MRTRRGLKVLRDPCPRDATQLNLTAEAGNLMMPFWLFSPASPSQFQRLLPVRDGPYFLPLCLQVVSLHNEAIVLLFFKYTPPNFRKTITVPLFTA
jgi:hypothetical protein